MGYLPFEKLKREIFVKKESTTSKKFGCNPEDRPFQDSMDYGVVNIDKPKGPTSHQVSAYVKDIIGLEKAGHSGTLDPKVTGVLPVALGRGTRIVQALLPAGKEYICVMHLHNEVSENKIKDVMNQFVGKIKQLPPIKSAIKRQWRFRKIYYIEIHDIQDQDVLFTVGCQAGTYIRKLCHDIGQELGVGGHMAELRRTKAGPFNEDSLVSLYDLKDAISFWKEEGNDRLIKKIINPIESAVIHLPKVWVLDSAVNSICFGADLKVPGISKIESDIQIDEMVAIMSLKGELVALGSLKMLPREVLKEDNGLVVKVEKTFMQPGIYPKIDKKD